MAFLLSLITSKLAGPIATAAALALAVMLGIATLQLGAARLSVAAWKASAVSWQTDAGLWKAATTAWRGSFARSEAARDREHGVAQTAVDGLTRQCQARVVEARRSSLAIHALVSQEPTYDPNHCPLRGLLGPERLRDALQPAGPGPR